MSVIAAFGRTPHSLNQLNNLRDNHAYRGLIAVVESVAQPVGRMRNQQSTPSCVGQAVTGAVEALTRFDGSAINLWIDARRREGNLDRADFGTTAEAAIESLIKRGLDPYQPNEESQPDEEYRQMPDLTEELAADDNRLKPEVERFIVDGSLANQRLAIVHALVEGKAVLWATGVKEPFFSLLRDQIAGDECVGADYNGHQMRMFAYDASRDLFGVQNSWGDEFAGMEFEGIEYPGCFWIRATSAIAGQWDTMVVDVKNRV